MEIGMLPPMLNPDERPFLKKLQAPTKVSQQWCGLQSE